MKGTGILLIIIGAIWTIIAFNMNTTVESGGEKIGSGAYSIEIPKMKVNNLGLMDERRNHLMFAGLTIVVGVILFGFGALSENRNVQSGITKGCPFCAEIIQAEAKFCRFCQKDLASIQLPVVDLEPSSRELPVVDLDRLGICPNCESEIPISSLECPKCKALFRPPSTWQIKPLPTKSA
jgi:hypothetical protein